ncbi:hypothetical protein GCM10027321_44740 [Massilia terrae]|uniref:Uncharacterized protein n=1 Tax=Massilia terrae TaxID=1811224 RepID=A0ABT2CZG8_9BURK|nr:hypothetical protein [Massilia terrae]MCS0659370.1 hypothetical protein [Massilia terrae]
MIKATAQCNGFSLTAWQTKQAAMLYFFTSEEYLRKLHKMVSDLLTGLVDPLLELAKAQDRDRLFRDPIWGNRNTSENWSNHAWPFLKDLQASLAQAVARRATNRFQVSGVNECLRGIYEYSLDWTTPSEEEMLKVALSTISKTANEFDDTVNEYENRWDDFCFAYSYPAFESLTHRIPKFRVRPDSQVETGALPARTGVYFSPDEPHASLQFAWAEHGGVRLRLANTFNELGLAALAAVGRNTLWFDEEKMLRFVLSEPLARGIRHEVLSDGEPEASLAPSAVARSAFTSKECTWMLVEPIPGEFEDLSVPSGSTPSPTPGIRKFKAGQACTESGFYFTPSSPGSRRHFARGEQMPSVNSGYGETIWQWDADQRS